MKRIQGTPATPENRSSHLPICHSNDHFIVFIFIELIRLSDIIGIDLDDEVETNTELQPGQVIILFAINGFLLA